MFLLFCFCCLPFLVVGRDLNYNSQCTNAQTIDGTIFMDGFHLKYFNVDFTKCDVLHGPTVPNLYFTLGSDIEVGQEAKCVNKETSSPTPAIYTDSDGKCYWIGALRDCTMTEYESKDQSFELTYPGYLSTENPKKRRSLRFHMKCVKGMQTVESKCLSVSTQSEETWYDVEVRSRYTCPSGPGSEYFRHNEFYVALVFFVLLGTGWFVFMVCLTAMFIGFLFLVFLSGAAKKGLYEVVK